jgi:CBS domain-containing protein
LQAKGYDVWSIAPDATVYDALALMAKKEVGALLVLEGEQVAGIVSERDYAKKVILKGKRSINTSVREIMSDEVFSVCPEQPIEECMALMTDKHVRHLTVCENDRLIGVVSIGDVVKSIISTQECVIGQLERYIEWGVC